MQTNILYGHSVNQTTNKPTVNPYDLRRRLMHVEAAISGTVPGTSSTGLPGDLNATLLAKRQNMKSYKLIGGTIYFVLPGTYTYGVTLDANQGDILCGDTATSGTPYSSIVTQIYPVGSRVLVAVEEYGNRGTIIGMITPTMTNYKFGWPHLLSQSGNAHYRNRAYIGGIVRDTNISLGLDNYANGRPTDTCDGDWRVTNMSGGGFHTDMVMTYMRQSEALGVWMYTYDQLLRTIARSISENTYIQERYVGLDEYESYTYQGIASYPWEAEGYLRKNPANVVASLYVDNDADDVLSKYNTSGKSFREPTTNVIPFYRMQEYGAYMGQGCMRQMVIPPISLQNSLNSYDVPYDPDSMNVPAALFSESVLHDGTYTLETTTGFHLVKQPNIITAKRIKDIDDKDGDDSSNGYYKFSGIGSGTFDSVESNNPTDYMLDATKIRSKYGLTSHIGDFRVIEEDDLPFKTDVSLGSLSDLSSEPGITAPTANTIYVDLKHGEIKIIGTRAQISGTPDGGIILRDGYGGEVALDKGNISLSCPGDIKLNAGRSIIMMAGDDIVERAKNSIDITSTDRDVRLKAEKNLDIVGGMGGVGRTLIENKSQGLPTLIDVDQLEGEGIDGHGLWLKSDSFTEAVSNTLYFRTTTGGSMLFDSGQGGSQIMLDGYTISMLASTEVTLGVGDGSPSGMFTLSGSSSYLTTTLYAGGAIYARGPVESDSGITVEPAKNWADGGPDQAIQAIAGAMTEKIQSYSEILWIETGPGNEDVIRKYTFSYRSSDQYGNSRIAVEVPYWQQLYSPDSIAELPTWNEHTYVYQDTFQQQPWPGYYKWEEGSVINNKPTMYDASTQQDMLVASGDNLDNNTEDVNNTPAANIKIMQLSQ